MAWRSPIPAERWFGRRARGRGVAAFRSAGDFEQAQLAELEAALGDDEKRMLGALLAAGDKHAIEEFVRTTGPNPLFDPRRPIAVDVGVARADRVDLREPPGDEAIAAILDGHVVHVLFQAGEASRFNRGPLYRLSPLSVIGDATDASLVAGFADDLSLIKQRCAALDQRVADIIAHGALGAKQPLMIRAALRRLIQWQLDSGRLTNEQASRRYREALARQKILFFVSPRGGVSEIHAQAIAGGAALRDFTPQNLVTIEQERVRGVSVDAGGRLVLLDAPWAQDAGGHLLALLQSARPGAFTTYSDARAPIEPDDSDALGWLASRGGRILSIVRINDMDRHTTEIVNAKALSYALGRFARGDVNVIEAVANPEGQKGGTGVTLGDPDIHLLTETHENSFPVLARAFDRALTTYLEHNAGRHPAYNAMRQLADLTATRRVLAEFGGRIVFVPRRKDVDGLTVSYLGADLPMGDLTLLSAHYRSRMFQLVGPGDRDLLIHDMKKREDLRIAVRTIAWQLQDPFIVAAAREVATGELEPFKAGESVSWAYGAPAPEFGTT